MKISRKLFEAFHFKRSMKAKSTGLMLMLGVLPLLIFGIVTLVCLSAAHKNQGVDIELSATVIIIVFAAMMIVSLIQVIVFQIIARKNVIRPIRTIVQALTDIQEGKITTWERLDVNFEDEFGELAKLFNSFIDAHEDITLQKKFERKLNEQNAELQEAMEMLKSTQLHMVQQERLAAIGQLAAGVAHEINNPLGYVSGNADMLKIYVQRYESILTEMRRQMAEQQPANPCCVYLDRIWQENKIDMVIADMPDLLDDITEGLKRISAIVNGLRGFSRNNLLEGKSTYDLNEGIKTTLLVANNEIKYNCDVRLELQDIPSVYANGGQINQVLLNIIINAAHAISTKFTNEKGLITVKTYFEDGKVCCSICDDGCGMTQDVKNRIFEPFFTTKPVGQGTGLGLGIVYDIVCKQHDGSIDVQSNPGEGTCFVFSLPVK